MTNYMKVKIDNMQKNSMYRLYGEMKQLITY